MKQTILRDLLENKYKNTYIDVCIDEKESKEKY